MLVVSMTMFAHAAGIKKGSVFIRWCFVARSGAHFIELVTENVWRWTESVPLVAKVYTSKSIFVVGLIFTRYFLNSALFISCGYYL